MYTQEQILDMYFDRNQQAVSATSQMYGAKLTRFADTMVAHEDALECVNDTYIAAWNKIPPERPMRFLSWLYTGFTGYAAISSATGLTGIMLQREIST